MACTGRRRPITERDRAANEPSGLAGQRRATITCRRLSPAQAARGGTHKRQLCLSELDSLKEGQRIMPTLVRRDKLLSISMANHACHPSPSQLAAENGESFIQVGLGRFPQALLRAGAIECSPGHLKENERPSPLDGPVVLGYRPLTDRFERRRRVAYVAAFGCPRERVHRRR